MPTMPPFLEQAYPYAESAVPSIPVPLWMAGSAIAGVIVVKALDWWLSRRSAKAHEDKLVMTADSTTKLIEQLNARIVSLEARQADIEGRLNAEIAARIEAQEKVSRLRHRISTLTSIMRHHQIEVPAEHPE